MTPEERKLHFEDIARRIVELIETEKLYLNPRFVLKDIFPRMGYKRMTLSYAINNCLGVSFYTYINGLRLEEARRLIKENKGKKFLSTKYIASASGFSSRCNYYRICMRMIGMSPTAWKLSLTGDQEANNELITL